MPPKKAKQNGNGNEQVAGNGHNGRHRRPGDVIETFGDFALGIAGAMGQGLAEFTKKRREQKEHNAKADFLADASAALVVTLTEAQDVAGQMRKELDEKR